MILTVDIGNTNIVIGCFEGKRLCFLERFETNQRWASLEYGVIFRETFSLYGMDASAVEGGIISSVVPSVTDTVKLAAERFTGSRFLAVGPGIKTGLKLAVDNPAQQGSDLVVAAVAAVHDYPVPQILIDMGTATTVSVIDRSGAFIGKMILPGVMVSLDALSSRAAQLPKVSLDPPKKLIGSNTVDSMKSGILYGSAGALDGLIDRIQEELGEPCTLIATGGLARVIVPLCRNRILLDEELLLRGLLLLYEKNC
ncbi:MAG: type III pantothenate kinase [Lachnospiraceae bacterium]|uniref:type III pantothenate kinase n=1 Tax=Candidatus Merdisoma sp. JLR.KK011 TaxID=3114299 RepID=UPI002FF29A18|nr:type III pantothenate kinase [Lachnospiraceae bacterium]